MSPKFKSALLALPILLGILFAVTKFDGAQAGTSAAYSITVYTSPPCYTGTCWAILRGTGTYVSIPSTGSSYFFNGSGLGPGTWDVYVCCNGVMGSAVVVLDAPYDDEKADCTLQGQCMD